MDINAVLLGETTKCEFKAALETSKPKSWLKSVSAFANGSGGSIYFGVSDNREIVGIEDSATIIDKISNLIKTKIEPMLIPDVNQIQSEGKIIIQVRIKPALNTPYYYVSDGSKTAFVRLGSESVIAPSHILNELMMRGKGLTFDSIVSDVKLDDISFTLFEATYKQKTKQSFDRNSDYQSFLLANGDGYLTNAGLLFADQCPFMQSRIFCTRWNGLSQGSVFEDAIDDKEYSGNIISILDSAETFIKNNSKFKWKKTGNGRIDMPDYPEIAVHEALVNSIIHRDYSLIGSEVHIDMFDDRLEITSPGGMFSGEKIQDLNLMAISSVRRNPTICDMFHRLKLMERRGSGIKKILADYKNNKPMFFSDSIIFKVTLKNTNYHNNEADVTINVGINVAINVAIKRTEEILEIIKTNNTLTSEELAKHFEVSKRTIDRDLSALKEDGLIKRMGSRKLGYWEIKN